MQTQESTQTPTEVTVEVKDRECDVLVIGAGLAGNCLTRQLSLQQPDLNIINIDKKTSFDYWVGESTLPVFADYATRVLKIGPYLWKNQMFKHGLRFFFDSEDKALSVQQMSECGRRVYPAVIAFQLDRARFDQHLCNLNRENGVEVLLGTHVLTPSESKTIEIDAEGGHVVQTNAGKIKCRYLVDAAGRSSPMERQYDLIDDDSDIHPVGSYWCRVRNYQSIDDVDDVEWRKRVGFTERMLSTNHFMYRGYWIWMIPVDDQTISLGVVFHRKTNPMKLRNGEELVEFFRQHRVLNDFLGDEPDVVDFYGLQKIRRHTKQRYSEDLWFTTGMSSEFVDPLISTTCVQIAWTNRYVAELIKTHRSGDVARFKAQVKHFNIAAETRYQYVRDRFDYRMHGSFDAFGPWFCNFMHIAYNGSVRKSYHDLKAINETVDAHGTACDCSQEKSTRAVITDSLHGATMRMLIEYTDYLDETGRYYELNSNQFLDNTPRSELERTMWEENLSQEYLTRQIDMSYEAGVRHCVGRMAEIAGIPWSESAFKAAFEPDWNQKQTLHTLLEALRQASPSEDEADRLNPWDSIGPKNDHDIGWLRAPVAPQTQKTT